MKLNLWVSATTLLGILGGADLARGDLTIHVDDVIALHGTIDPSKARTGKVYYDGNPVAGPNDVYAGAFALTIDKINNVTQNPKPTILTFCTDILADWQTPASFQAKSFSASTGVNPQWSTQPPNSAAIQNASWLYNTRISSGLTQDQFAGLQLAIWEVLYDTVDSNTTSWNLSTGHFTSQNFNGGKAQAGLMLADLGNARSQGSFTEYTSTWLKPTTPYPNQGLIISPATPVPEPATYLVAFLLSLPIGVNTLRFLRRRCLG